FGGQVVTCRFVLLAFRFKRQNELLFAFGHCISPAFVWFYVDGGSGAFQFGNGFRLEFRKAVIRSRIRVRRSHRALSNRFNPSESCWYHSSGISSAIAWSSSKRICSIRERTGSNDCQEVTAAYTELRAYTPRSGWSGKSQDPALKQ